MAYDFGSVAGAAYITRTGSFIDKDDPRPITITLRHKASDTSSTAGGSQSWFFTNNFEDGGPQIGVALGGGNPCSLRLYSEGNAYTDSNTFASDTTGFRTYMWVWDTDNSYTMYRDGVSVGSGTKALSGTSGSNTAAIGALTSNVGLDSFRIFGEIAEFAIWDRILSSAEAAAVHAGTPLNVPSGIISYLPFYRDDEQDLVDGAWSFTSGASGTPAATSHPAVIRPSTPITTPNVTAVTRTPLTRMTPFGVVATETDQKTKMTPFGFVLTETIAADTGGDVTLDIGSGAYTVSGQDVTLTYTPLSNFPITIDAGAYSVSGQNVDLLPTFVTDVGTGSYAVTGQDVQFNLDYVIAVESGTYSVNGRDIGLIYSEEDPAQFNYTVSLRRPRRSR